MTRWGWGWGPLKISMNGWPTATCSAPHLIRGASVGPGSLQTGLTGAALLPTECSREPCPLTEALSFSTQEVSLGTQAPQPGKGQTLCGPFVTGLEGVAWEVMSLCHFKVT